MKFFFLLQIYKKETDQATCILIFSDNSIFLQIIFCMC